MESGVGVAGLGTPRIEPQIARPCLKAEAVFLSVPVPLRQRLDLAAPDAQVSQLVVAHAGQMLRVGAAAAVLRGTAAPAAQGMHQALMKGRVRWRCHDGLLVGEH